MIKLTVIKTGHGTGTVNGSYDSAGISCGATCQATYRSGTPINLTATADSGQQFIGWTSTPSSTTCTGRAISDCSFSLTQDTTVQADFSPPPNYVFTTSTQQNAVLGGLKGADALCAARAAAGKLSGTYVAWLSTASASAVSRLKGASGWIRPGDSMPVLNNIEDIANNKFFYPPRMDELGTDLGADQVVITATNVNGTADIGATNTTCGDFTSGETTPVTFVSGGFASANSGVFTAFVGADCGAPSRLYCFGIDRQAQVVAKGPVARFAFMTKADWTPGKGIGTADALCQQDATAAGLAGTYRALLAPSGSTIASRFGTAGSTWARVDGVPLAASAELFFQGTTFGVPPNMSADGSVYYGQTGVWTGAVSPTTVGTAASTCGDWLSTSGQGQSGVAGDTSVDVFYGQFSVNCNSAGLKVACLQI
jgi:hypothetical protein